MTGGMAFEALNNAGRSGTRLLIILNDNDHSINANVGAVADLFGKVRVSSAYYQAKLWTKKRVSAIPYIGKALYTGFHNTKSALKRWLYRKSIFQQMGLEYLGPIDGHDLKELYDALMAAKAIEKPCILHIKTVKGKGYPFAEQEPTRFHGTSGFDIATGRDTAPKKPGFSGELGKLLCKKAGENAKLCAITAAMASGTGLESFERRYPDRFYDVGIAEQHAVTFAAGLAKGGLIPVIAIYSTFLQRAYDQMLHDVALQGLHVIFAIDRAGFVGADGATHQGLFDLSYLRQMPGMTIYSPATFSELAQCLEEALTVDGPCAIRYPKGGEADLHTFLPHGDYLLSHRPGAETLLLTYGREAEICQEAARLALEQGVSVDVVKLLKLQPLDCKALQLLFEGYRAVWIVEESEAAGSLGEFLAAGIPWNTPPHLRAVHGFVPHATEGEQREFCGLDAASICREILEEQGH